MSKTRQKSPGRGAFVLPAVIDANALYSTCIACPRLMSLQSNTEKLECMDGALPTLSGEHIRVILGSSHFVASR
jgi:hypothetical protein